MAVPCLASALASASPSFARSASGYTAPEGLFGEFTSTARVLGPSSGSSAAKSSWNPSSVGAVFRTPPWFST